MDPQEAVTFLLTKVRKTLDLNIDFFVPSFLQVDENCLLEQGWNSLCTATPPLNFFEGRGSCTQARLEKSAV